MGNVKTAASAGASGGAALAFYWLVRAAMPADELGHLAPDEVAQAREVISSAGATMLAAVAGYAWALVRSRLPRVPEGS